MRDPHALLNLILALHRDVRDEIIAATERQGVERMASIAMVLPMTFDCVNRVALVVTIAWVGYANARVRSQVEPLLQQTLRARGWIDDEG